MEKHTFEITLDNRTKIIEEIRSIVESNGLENYKLRAGNKETVGKSIFSRKVRESYGLFNDEYFVTLYLKSELHGYRGTEQRGTVRSSKFNIELKLTSKNAIVTVLNDEIVFFDKKHWKTYK